MVHGVAEHLETHGFVVGGGGIEARPEWVLCPVRESLGVRHESEHETGGVADAGDASSGAVEVVAIGVHERDLAAVAEVVVEFVVAGDESAFAVCAGENAGFGIGAQGLCPDADGVIGNADAGPSIFKSSGLVVGEGDVRCWRVVRPWFTGARAWEQSHLGGDLETVAWREDRNTSFDGSHERCVEVLPHELGHDAAGGHGIAIAESAGNPDELVVVDQFRPIDERVEVDEFGLGTGKLESVGQFLITVDARSGENECFCHGGWVGSEVGWSAARRRHGHSAPVFFRIMAGSRGRSRVDGHILAMLWRILE